MFSVESTLWIQKNFLREKKSARAKTHNVEKVKRKIFSYLSLNCFRLSCVKSYRKTIYFLQSIFKKMKQENYRTDHLNHCGLNSSFICVVGLSCTKENGEKNTAYINHSRCLIFVAHPRRTIFVLTEKM